LKSHKDKLEHSEQIGKRNTQDSAVKVMADRNDLLKQLMKDTPDEKSD
jgi:hypothetical protein